MDKESSSTLQEVVVTKTFSELLEEHISHLRRFAFALTTTSAEAEDLVQQTIERAISRKRQFIPGTCLEAWLFKIMRTRKTDNDRYTIVRRRIHYIDYNREHAHTPPNNEEEIFATLIFRTLQLLSDKHREIIRLADEEGLSYREIAESLQIPLGTVMSRLERARAVFRWLLDGIAVGEKNAPPVGAGHIAAGILADMRQRQTQLPHRYRTVRHEANGP